MSEQVRQVEHHKIPGLTPREADFVVDLAFQNNRIRDALQSPSMPIHNNPEWQSRADLGYRINESHIAHFAGREALGDTVEFDPKLPTPDDRRRARVQQVVDPSSGRIVDYGRMRPGSHPSGGKIVGYR